MQLQGDTERMSWQVQTGIFPQVAALTSCAWCRRRGRGRVSLRLCTASALQCGARPWGAWGWTPRCAGSPPAACGGRWSTHSGGVKTHMLMNANTLLHTGSLKRTVKIYTHTHIQMHAHEVLCLICPFMKIKTVYNERLPPRGKKQEMWEKLASSPQLSTKKNSCSKALFILGHRYVIIPFQCVPVWRDKETKKKKKNQIKTSVSDCHAFSPTNTHQGRVGRVSTTFGPN